MSLEHSLSVVSQVLYAYAPLSCQTLCTAQTVHALGNQKIVPLFSQKECPSTWWWMLLQSPMLEESESINDCNLEKKFKCSNTHTHTDTIWVFFLLLSSEETHFFPLSRLGFTLGCCARLNLCWTLVLWKHNVWMSDLLTPPIYCVWTVQSQVWQIGRGNVQVFVRDPK